MKVAVFTTHAYERDAFESARAKLGFAQPLTYLEASLNPDTVSLAQGYEVIIPFVNDQLTEPAMLRTLATGGTRLIALRSAGYNNLNLPAARAAGLRAVHVPGYTPHAVAEFVFALLLALMRNVPRAVNRVREQNFSLEGLIGSVLAGRSFGIVGLGKIGRVVAGIAQGFGCQVLVSDPVLRPDDCPGELVPLDELLRRSHVVSLHAPLLPTTQGMIGARALALMPDGAFLINTSRGPLVDSVALVAELLRDRLGGVAIDVYDREAEVFFTDQSNKPLQDDVLARLMSFPKVIVTSHMGFMTWEALAQITETTLTSISAFAAGQPLSHELKA